jgi:uncharacterized membrane protein YeaQ/YmgE (transglycosylase-associated protein family)
MIIGSIIGGYLPSLWGENFLSYWGIITSALGGIVGIYIGFKLAE